MKPLFFPISFLFLSSIILAQEGVQNDSITQLDEVILLDALKTKNAPGIVASDVIGAKVFQNYSPVDMVSAINQIPGVYVLSGALNTNRITIRGVGARTLFGTDKLRMYYNDIPVTDGTGSSTIEAYDLENLSQIEVIKGPKGTTYGANLGGAIILTPKEALGKTTTFWNNLTVGSFGLIKNNFSFNQNDGKLRIGLQYGHLETDGYRENNRFERDGMLLNASYRFSPKDKLGLLVNHIDYSAQIPSSIGATAFAENPRQAAFTWKAAQGYEANNYTLIGLNHEHRFNEKLKNSSSIFYTYLDHYEPRPFGILDEFTNGFGFRSKFDGSFHLGGKPAAYILGGELYKDEYHWNEYENRYQDNNGNGSLQGDPFAENREFRSQWNAFGTISVNVTKAFTAQMGLNFNKTRYDFRDLFNTGAENRSADRDFKAILLPSIDLGYIISTNHRLYANVGRGYSNPSLAETLTPDGVINPDIKQETGTNYELGSQLYFDEKKLSVNIAIYRMDIKNLLVAQRVGDDQFIGKNAGKTKHQGLELGLSYALDLSPNISVSPFFNYTISDHSFIDFVDGSNNYSGNPLTGVPKNRLNAGLQVRLFNDFYWNTTYQYVGAIPLTDANSLSSEPFNLFTARLGYGKKLSDRISFGIDFGINNLFDVVYAQSVLINTQAFGGAEPRYYYPGDGRNFYGSLRLGYKL
jgi:iron complex outermembrane receptor protein